ncbi:MAG: 50S ribosomal protein L15 [Rickettsiaceae bacterium]|nr:50S ribosomal protein L15 [Rickettsiaceae bacterium]
MEAKILKLNELVNLPGSKKNKKRVGRGIGSGKGKTCGRGMKGQKSRSGVAIKTEGGQMPLIKRLPKRGFNCSKSINYTAISIDDLERLVANKKINIKNAINIDILVAIGYIKNKSVPVKLLAGSGKVTSKFNIGFSAYSKSAKSAIEAAGGKFS